jgi:hypothetical protein
LEKHLKICCENIIYLDVIVGEQGKKCCLVVMRVASEINDARRAERCKKLWKAAKKLAERPSPRRLIPHANQSEYRTSGCELTRRNLPRPSGCRNPVSGMETSAKPRQNLNRKSNEHHLQPPVLAEMIAH